MECKSWEKENRRQLLSALGKTQGGTARSPFFLSRFNFESLPLGFFLIYFTQFLGAGLMAGQKAAG
jgi:hypothetical protein